MTTKKSWVALGGVLSHDLMPTPLISTVVDQFKLYYDYVPRWESLTITIVHAEKYTEQIISTIMDQSKLY
jgi:hypothetical protein